MIGFLEEIVMTSFARKRELFGSSSSPRGRASGVAMDFVMGRRVLLLLLFLELDHVSQSPLVMCYGVKKATGEPKTSSMSCSPSSSEHILDDEEESDR